MPCFANDHQGLRLQERKQLPIALSTYQCLMPSKETTASFEEKEPPDFLSPVSSPTRNVSDYPPPLAAQLSDSEYLLSPRLVLNLLCRISPLYPVAVASI